MIAFLVLAQVLDSYAGLGLDRLPDIERDDLRLVVLGDSFAGQSRSRIPTALLSELPEGQLVGVRTSVHTLYARPVRTQLLSERHLVVNDQGFTSGCRELELDVGGNAWMRLPIGGLFDLRLDARETGQSLLKLSYGKVDPSLNESRSLFEDGLLVRGVGRFPTNGLSPAHISCAPWSESCVVEGAEPSEPSKLHQLFETSSASDAPELNSGGEVEFLVDWNGGGDTVQLTDVIFHGMQSQGASEGLYFTPLTDVSWGYYTYSNPEPCAELGLKGFTDEELQNWLVETSVRDDQDLVFMMHLDTEKAEVEQHQMILNQIWHRIDSVVESSGLGPNWSFLVVVPFRHDVNNTGISGEVDSFEDLWEAVRLLAEEHSNVSGVSLYHYFQGVRFDGGYEARRFLIENCQGQVTWNQNQVNLVDLPFQADLLDPQEIHMRDAYSARYMANALLRALRGWSFPGDLNQDGSLDSADLSALLAQWGAVGVNEADLDGSGVVDDQDLDLLSQRLDCAVPYPPPPPPLSPDLDGDGLVGISDLLLLLANWGSDDPAIDITRDGVVDWSDQLIVLSNWTSSP